MANSFPYSKEQTVPLHVHFKRTNQNRKNQTILYFHGGGLVYGSATDLPQPYEELILEAGYDLLMVEYPLAPEVKLDRIFFHTRKAVEWFLEHYADTLDLPSNTYHLFGRSAGAFLAAMTTHQVPTKPEALVLFYGYYSLAEASFHVPNRYYLKYPTQSDAAINNLIATQPLANATDDARFALYVHYRQTGEWSKKLLPEGISQKEFSLSPTDLASFPPTFLAAATEDYDVPYRISKKMASLLPDATLETIDLAEHDFDRTYLESVGMETYKKMLDWLNKKTN